MRIRPHSLPHCLVLFAASLGTMGVSAAVSRADDAPKQVDVFLSGTGGYHTYRIPAVVLTNRQTLLAFCEGRKTGRGDQGDLDLMLRRSTDGGNTWQPLQLVYEEGGTAKITIGNPCPVVDRQTGTVWLPFCRNNDRVFITHSTDDGQTWAKPVEITADVKKPAWGWYATGPGHGIQLAGHPEGTRLVIPCDCRDREGQGDWDQRGHSLVFYSDDHGKTWKLGGVTEAGMNECQAVELADGALLLSMRNYLGKSQRAFATSRDGGLSWSQPKLHPQVYCPTCQSSIQRYSLKPRNIILYCGPGGPGRSHLTVRLSYDEGRTWPVAKVIYDGSSAYSDLVVLPDGTIGCLYECDDYKRITFARFTLDWLTDGKAEEEKPQPLRQPRLLVKLPEICPTPDGMALDAQGNVILACPNYADQTHPAVLMKIDRENRVRLFCQMPTHPETGVACPMGIEFGPDGNLYVADNQGWVKPNNKGRVLRLKFRSGQPVASEVVAYGMSHPNGVRVHRGYIYVTQSLLLKKGDQPLVSGVYRFRLDDKGVKVENTLQDKNLLVTLETLNPDCQYGADGLAFDSQGNLYVGNFGDATLHKITFDAAGKVASNTRWAKDPSMKSIDGICLDREDHVYVADFSGNAICVVSLAGKVRVLAKSPDCDGADGGLDQPGEPLLRGNELIVSNFDMVTGPDKLNSKHDYPYTLSVISLDKQP